MTEKGECQNCGEVVFWHEDEHSRPHLCHVSTSTRWCIINGVFNGKVAKVVT